MNSQSKNYKWFVLAILTLVYVFNFMDRQIMILLQEPIKKELGLSDTQLALLTGLAFSLLYTFLGIPLARVADTSNRKKLLAFSLAFWSVMTVLSGRALNFIQMALTRVGVSVGEAGGMPPSHSILSDYFPAKQRGTVFAIYNSGLYIGVLLGYVLAGLLAANYGWRFAFLSLGLPGIILAFIVYFTIKEPTRGQIDGGVDGAKKDQDFFKVAGFLLSQKSYKYTCLAVGLFTYSSYSLGNFLPSYLIRFHELDIKTIGVVLGSLIGIGGIIGAIGGGRLADKLGAKDVKWYLYIPAIACLCQIIPALIILFSSNANTSLYTIFPYTIFNAALLGPMYAVGQSLAQPHMRGLATALIVFSVNIIGLTCGPLVVGFISDMLAPEYGALSLRYAIAINLVGFIGGALFFWIAAKHYEKDLANLKAELV